MGGPLGSLGADAAYMQRPVGILTRTVVRSPVVHWILHARIRHQALNDVIFVGDDFVHVKQVKHQGHLEHVAIKNDFDTRIRNARTFNSATDARKEGDFVIKSENEDDSRTGTAAPPQLLVLTTESNDIIFLYLNEDDRGRPQFVQQTCPMPTFDRVLFQPGYHLAVDELSRAIAVAANEREVVIYSAKTKDRMKYELRTQYKNWCPVSAQRPLKVEGVIQHMEFLLPPSDDGDHIILLLVVVDQRKTKAIWIDWYYSSDIHHATVHPGQPLDTGKSVASLLIPLRNAAFLLITGNEMKRYRNLLSSSVTGHGLGPIDVEPLHPGSSAQKPMWASWCRPRRNMSQENDYVYLVREDGLLYWVSISTHDSVASSLAGDFGCHIGTGFASLGDSHEPDIFAVAGDMSSGSVQFIGRWPSIGNTNFDIDRVTTMEMELVETIPNWATVTDMVTSTLPQSSARSARSRDGVFVTSGRQPYGSVTELRRGIESRLSVYVELQGLRSVTNIWALSVVGAGSIVLLLSNPYSTRVLSISADFTEISELENEEVSALDTANRTLVASTLPSDHIIQVTERAVCVAASASASFEDKTRRDCGAGSTIVAAAVEPSSSAIVFVESVNKGLILRWLTYDVHAGLEEAGEPLHLNSEPVCLTVTHAQNSSCVLVVDVVGILTLYTYDGSRLMLLDSSELPGEGQSLFDHVTVLRKRAKLTGDCSESLVVCGSRDGRLHSVRMATHGRAAFADSSTIDFGLSAVKLVQPSDNPCMAYAMCGLDTCRLSWEATDICQPSIHSLWVTDKDRPELAQGLVTACAQVPASDVLAFPEMAGALITTSGDELLVTALDATPSTVPRHIPVSGTPNRLIYAEQQRCLVCASVRTGVRTFAPSLPHARPEERRQIWPVIDFIPSRSSTPSFTYDLQPGERVYALLEWSVKQDDGKTYSFIMVGGSYFSHSGTVKGRIAFLQPVNRSWEVVDVQQHRNPTRFDAPVYALALFDEVTYVACSGQYVHVARFSIKERRWDALCASYKLASPGISLTVTVPLIYISTIQDSLVTLRLEPSDPNNNGGFSHKLDLVTTGPRADNSLSHLVVRLQTASYANGSQSATSDILPDNGDLALLSTKHGQILGLTSPHATTTTQPHSKSASLLFEAQLPRSLTRIRQCNVRPRWKPAPASGVMVDNLLGSAPDGTLIGICILEEGLWRRLSWLQRLCEWSEVLSPLSGKNSVYAVTEEAYGMDERALPVGLAAEGSGEIVMKSSRPRDGDGHVDGDVLARLVERGGADTLKAIIGQVAERDDGAGVWVREHLQQELEAVDTVVKELKMLLDCWL